MKIGRLWGRWADKEKIAPRMLAHAWDCEPGDFVRIALTGPGGLENENLEAERVLRLNEGNGQVRRIVEFTTAKGLTVRIWRGEGDRVALAREAVRAQVEELFRRKRFAMLFQADEPPTVVLERKREPEELAGWTSEIYRQEGAWNAGYEDGTEIDRYRLVSDERSHAVEVEVFDGGRTQIWLIALRAERVVEELWPGQGTK